MNDPYGLLLCDDLIFTSRITGTAKALGLSLRTVKSPGDLLRFVEQKVPRCVIVDLNTPGLVIGDFARALSALGGTGVSPVQTGATPVPPDISPKPLLIGYGSHVDTATLKAAREAGFDIVWPRSKFVEELSAMLPEWFKPMEVEP